MSEALDELGHEGKPAVVPDELLESVVSLLGPLKGDAPAFRKSLRKIAEDWAVGFWLGPSADPGDQRIKIQRVVIAVDSALNAIAEVAPEYQVALGPNLGPEFRSHQVVFEAQSALLLLRKAAQLFGEAFEPRRGARPNIELEEAIRDLIDLFMASGCSFPKVIVGRDGAPSRLINGEAKAIDLIVRSTSDISTRAIANMIEKVRKCSKPTDPPEFAIWRTDPNSELDCSLLPAHKRIPEN